MSFADNVRGKVTEHVKREKELWSKTTMHSAAYRKALKLLESDLEALLRIKDRPSPLPDTKEHADKNFLAIPVNGKQFALTVHHVCGVPYGGTWTTVILAICTSDDSVNESVGRGTTLITTLSDEWHDKLMARLMGADDTAVSH